ncbi:MAG: trypsin-like peptidase domain-containing protein [Verrucomicrobiota bacterium]|nr:trypsin-like peptidase domain-containing protein [Verrucomicrobiota bacterium]
MRNITCFLSLLLIWRPAIADTSNWDKTPESITDLQAIQKQVQKVLPKCMAATVTLQMGGSSGSGVVVNKNGLVLTAGHVSGRPGRAVTVILNDGRKLKGKALGMHKGSDSGMVRIADPPDDLPIVDFDKSKDKLPKTGQWCIAVGNPGGLDKERGVVVRVGRVIRATRTTVRTDCMLLGGDSGGPLFDFNGVVIGIHSRISSATDQNMHVAMTAFQDEWEGLIDPSSKIPAFLGVYTENNEPGALVLEVRDNSPAKKAGILKDDILQKVNDKEIKDAVDLTDIIRGFRPGTKVKITMLRAGKKKVIEVNLGSREDDGASTSPEKKDDKKKKDDDK